MHPTIKAHGNLCFPLRRAYLLLLCIYFYAKSQSFPSIPFYFLLRYRLQRLVLAVGDDLFHQFHVLNMLLGSIHGFLHQPVALDAEHGILVHKFLDDDACPLQHGSGLLLLLRP